MTMSISGGASRGVADISAILRASLTTASGEAGAASSASSDRADISGPAALMNKLKTLQQDDPEKFKAVMSSVADALSAKANSASDPQEQRALADIASKFKSAGESGDLSSLEPPRGQRPGAGGGPPGPPPAASKSASGGEQATASKQAEEIDPADTNEDGTVSRLEKAVYEAKQAAKAEAAKAYSKQAEVGQRDKLSDLFASVSATVDAAL